MKKLIATCVTVFLLLTVLPTVSAASETKDRGMFIPNDESGIVDTALYEYIKIQSGKGEVYSNDLENITTLKLSDKIYSIKSIDGLSLMNMPNLCTLELDISTLDNLDEVVKFDQIKELIILNSSIHELPDTMNEMEGLDMIEIHNSPIEELNPSLYQIPFLDSIVLDNLPLLKLDDEITDMRFMESIELYSMHIDIPESIYSNPRLRTLKLENMGITELSENISNLERLEELSLANNELTAIPDGIYALTSLQTLNLRNNHISEISGKIEGLYNLKSLDVSHNMLTSLPIQIASLSNLRSLSISENPIECLDSDFGLLELTNVYDIFEYNEIAKCDIVTEEPVLEETILSILNNVVSSDGYTNQDVTVISNNEVFFVVDMVMQSEPSKEVTISEEGNHKVDAVMDDLGTVATIAFTIDRKAPTIKIQNNDMLQNGFSSDIAIESDEQGTFYVNGVSSGTSSMLLVSENGDYEVYVVDAAGNKSNVLNFYIEKAAEDNTKVVKEKEKEVPYGWYVFFIIFVAVGAYVAFIFLRKGAELDNEY